MGMLPPSVCAVVIVSPDVGSIHVTDSFFPDNDSGTMSSNPEAAMASRMGVVSTAMSRTLRIASRSASRSIVKRLGRSERISP